MAVRGAILIEVGSLLEICLKFKQASMIESSVGLGRGRKVYMEGRGVLDGKGRRIGRNTARDEVDKSVVGER